MLHIVNILYHNVIAFILIINDLNLLIFDL